MTVLEFTVVNDIVLHLDYMWCVVGKDYRFVINMPELPTWDADGIIRLKNPTDTEATIVVNMILCSGSDKQFNWARVRLKPNETIDVPTSIVYEGTIITSCINDLSNIEFGE